MHEPVPEGMHQGMYCPPDELNAMLDVYYTLRGWTSEGIPTPEKLGALGQSGAVGHRGVGTQCTGTTLVFWLPTGQRPSHVRLARAAARVVVRELIAHKGRQEV